MYIHVCTVIVESRSVLANSRVAAAQRCVHRLKHLIDVPCHAEKMEVIEPLRSVDIESWLNTSNVLVL